MTDLANRNNIEPVFGFITQIVVVFFCRFAARALQGMNSGQFATTDSGIDCIFSFLTLWKLFLIFSDALLVVLFTLFALSVSVPTFFTLFTLPIPFFTCLALILIAIFAFTIWVKFRNRFDLFAIATSFCYDLFRHAFLLTRKSCLEPLESQSLCGLFYCNTTKSKSKDLFKNLVAPHNGKVGLEPYCMG